jgi:glycosyltransferase involved in cell wall biosynthesis
MGINLMSAVPTGLPAQAAMFNDGRMHRAIRLRLAADRFDLSHIQLARMAVYLANERRLPRLIDLIDALSVNMARRANLEPLLLRMALREESRRLARFEQRICASYDTVTVVSEADRSAIGDRPNLLVNPNGIDVELFRPRAEPRRPDRMIMTGNMGYFPNIDGLRWFVEKVLPAIKNRRPRAHLDVVGVNPHPDVHRLAQTDRGVRVLGYVADLALEIATAAVAIVPLRSGSGMQFKAIEAMACGTPVVASRFGIGGLGVENNRELLVADTPSEFADAVCRLLEDPELSDRLARVARSHVIANFSWPRLVSELEEMYARTISARHQRFRESFTEAD